MSENGVNPFPPPQKGVGSRPPVPGSQRWFAKKLCEVIESQPSGSKEQLRALNLLAKSRNNYQSHKPRTKGRPKKQVELPPEPIVSSDLVERISNYDSKPNGGLNGHQAESIAAERPR